ncbi:MAG: pyrC [Herbinix sp.]|jgi:dihydroorotase|nr:pyrC [Herbinix sp.]
MQILIRNGYIIDPASEREGIFDLLIENDTIRRVEKDMNSEEMINIAKDQELKVIDAKGKYVMPGFIDLHVHLREPGFEYKETIASGAMAAAAGGYTSICPMPNTKPATDSPEIVQLILEKAKQEAVVNIFPVGAITLGQEGKELADLPALKRAGIVAFSEDGKSVMDTSLYAKAMKRAAELQIPIFAHCEDKSLVGRGAINAGKKAEELGLPGISNAVEDIITARDILLSKDTGAQLHICHISTRDSARMVGLAKQEGLRVTGEVCPHHFILTDEDIPGDDADYKMNPPLRSKEDVQYLKEALRDGILDVISTDHAPHSEEEKRKSCKEAPFGIVGSETAFALTWTELVKAGYLTVRQLVEKMSLNPARILGIDRGCIGVGKIADLTIVDPETEYIIDRDQFYSMGKNTPFHGRRVTGRVEYTLVAGKLVYEFAR